MAVFAIASVGILVGIGLATASEDVLGVFGVRDFGETTVLALWLPVESSRTIEAIRWYNNDSETTFEEILCPATFIPPQQNV